MTAWSFSREKYLPIIIFVGIAYDNKFLGNLLQECFNVIDFSKNYYGRLYKEPPEEFFERSEYPVRIIFSLAFPSLTMSDQFYRDFIRNYPFWNPKGNSVLEFPFLNCILYNVKKIVKHWYFNNFTIYFISITLVYKVIQLFV